MSDIKKQRIGSTRDFVPIKEVKDWIVVLEDGTMVALVLATSINLALKSYEEQQAVLAAFQNFLNTLDFPIQISVLSRKMDIGPYLEVLEERLKEQENELIKLQTIEYISFIKNFAENVNVMEKQFFIVVSYTPMLESTKKNLGIIGKLFSSGKKADEEAEKRAFENGKIQLEQRVATIQSALGRTGVKTKILDTEAILEVFYSIYNPGTDSDLVV